MKRPTYIQEVEHCYSIPEEHTVKIIKNGDKDDRMIDLDIIADTVDGEYKKFNINLHPEITTIPTTDTYKDLIELPKVKSDSNPKYTDKIKSKITFYFEEVISKLNDDNLIQAYKEIEQNSSALIQFKTLEDQVLYLKSKLQPYYKEIRGINSHIEILLNHSVNTVKYFKSEKMSKDNGKPFLIPKEKQLQLLNAIRRTQVTKKPIIYPTLLCYINCVLNIKMSRKQMLDFLPTLEKYGVKTHIARKMESDRKVNVDQLNDYIKRATEIV